MNKIRVIDLLNKIANGEEVPKKIRFNDIEYTLDQNIDSYWNNEKKQWLESRIYGHCLNNEVEIIEEPKGIPEKLRTWYSVEENQSIEENCNYANDNFETTYDKINEIIDYLKSKGE